jgi:hypothetical protein
MPLFRKKEKKKKEKKKEKRKGLVLSHFFSLGFIGKNHDLRRSNGPIFDQSSKT